MTIAHLTCSPENIYIILIVLVSLSIFSFNILEGQFFRVHVGIQSPEGISTSHIILRRFTDFLKLFTSVSK